MSEALHDRTRLPDALRTLLDAFPRETWEAHPNFEGLVAFWLDRHLMFRRLGETLRTDTEAVIDGKLDPDQHKARLSRLGGALLQQLHGHHQIEDHHYFPVLAKRETRLARGFDILDADHHALDGLLHRFADKANGVIAARTEAGVFLSELVSFESMLDRHLEDEEELVVPVILKHGPDGLG